MPNLSPQQAAIPKEALIYYIDHPVAFAEDCVFHCYNKTVPANQKVVLDKQQKDFMDAVAKYKRVGCKKGHGTGGSMSCALLVLWFLFTRPDEVKIPVTAPTHHQLEDVLWPEISKWLQRSYLTSLITWTTDSVYMTGYRETKFARARTVAKGQSENLQGFHSQHLMFVIDEGFGIKDDDVWQVINGSMTGGDDNKMLFLGQPSVVVGFCYNAFTRFKDKWSHPHGALITHNCEESSVVDHEWLSDMRSMYPRHHDIYRVRCLGEFPMGNPESFIQLADAESARIREITPSGLLEIGFDPARQGDDLAVITVRQGHHVFPQEHLAKSTHTQNAEFIVSTLRKYRLITGYQGRVRVKIDMTGTGEGTFDILHDSKDYVSDNIEAVAVDFRKKSFRSKPKGDTYYDLTSYMWGQLKEVINDIQLPDDQLLIDEIAARRVDYKTGFTRIEPKEEFKRDYKKSPDRSDSLILCFADYVEERKVVSSFDKHNESLVSDFVVDWNKTNGRNSLHYGAMCLMPDGSLCFMATLWDDQTGHLYVYQEGLYDYPMPKEIAVDLVLKMNLQRFTHEKILGNELMFSEEKRGLAKLITRELPNGIGGVPLRITPAKRYDPYGSIALSEQMFAEGRITVHQTCERTEEQLDNWIVEKGKSSTDGKGFCECILMTLSTLTRTLPEIPKMISKREYWRPDKYGVVLKKPPVYKLGV